MMGRRRRRQAMAVVRKLPWWRHQCRSRPRRLVHHRQRCSWKFLGLNAWVSWPAGEEVGTKARG